MATTSIWAVKGWLGKVVLYIENPEKTENPQFYRQKDMTDVQTQNLSDVIDYAARSDKTTAALDSESVPILRQLVSGINCLPATARDEMLAVKKRFGKEDGVVAYHGYQSFAPGEATPELAHEIGVKLARKLWGEKYQVLVSTHLDKENHLHSHFVVNTVSFVDGIRYNPFVYLTNDNEVQMLVTNLFKATTPKGAQSQDPFWDSTASILLSALVYYLYHEAPPEEQNFPMVMEMLRAGEVREDDDSYLSPLDVLFERLEMRDPEHIAVKYYKQYRSGSAKTLKSIQITLASHMEKFNLDSLIALTATDELHLQDMGEKRVALFALIPDSDTSFNFLVSILYQQLFQQLFDSADHKHGGSLPVPVHFLMDEFANISLPNDFEIKLSTMRSRNVFVSIILQNIAQLKALFEKQWESVLGNCDELLYLGGNEQGSHKYISELLGKATIDTNTYGKSSGRNGNYSTNYQITGRELMTPDEVRMLDNRKALLFIRGELPVCDDKFDILTHPLVSRTPDGGGLPYVHGGTEQAVASIRVDDWQWGSDEEIPAADLSEQKFELLSSEELEAIFMEEHYDEAS